MRNIQTIGLIVILSTILLAAVAVSQSGGTNSMPNRVPVKAWNDEAQTLWESAWGGSQIKRLFDPDIGQLSKKHGIKVDDRYRKDTVKWLSIILRVDLIPPDLWEHAVAVKSHLFCATETIVSLEKVRPRLEKLTLDYQIEAGSDQTDGIIVRYETGEYIVLVVDEKEKIAVLIREKNRAKIQTATEQRIEYMWEILRKVFAESIWKTKGEIAQLSLVKSDPETDVMTAFLHSPSAKPKIIDGKEAAIDAILNDQFEGVNITLPPGPVVKAVFLKRLVPKEKTARLYIPHTRFEEGTLFDSQDF